MVRMRIKQILFETLCVIGNMLILVTEAIIGAPLSMKNMLDHDLKNFYPKTDGQCT